MKPWLLLIFLFLLNANLLIGQDHVFDSLKLKLENAKGDSAHAEIMVQIEDQYGFYQRDSAIAYFERAIKLAESSNLLYGQWRAYSTLSIFQINMADYDNALASQLIALKIAEKLPYRRLETMATTYRLMCYTTRIIKQYDESLKQMRLAIQCQMQSGKPLAKVAGVYTNASLCFLGLGMPDSAMEYFRKGMAMFDFSDRSAGLIFATKGNIEYEMGQLDSAEASYRKGIYLYEHRPQHDNQYYKIRLYISMAQLFLRVGKGDSCTHYARLAYEISHRNEFIHYELESANVLSKYYESQRQSDSVVKYLNAAIVANDSVFSQARMRHVQSLNLSEEQRQRDIEAAKERIKNQIRFYSLIAALAVFLLIAFILYRNNRQKQKANILLQSQKQEIENTLATLKTTQNQLVQSEKMASLGELTAGIAHEIQNPLNFVNNFSELNTELIDEFDKALQEDNKVELSTIAKDLKQNLEKINFHGKRADSIVKSMLQHSQKGGNNFEPTDLNAMLDEYARLSYHGFRAKDKSFTVSLQTELDPLLGKINMIPQDLGRVLLNLFNNAFYSMAEKMKQSKDDYKPSLVLKTRKSLNQAEIFIRDNGTGIQQKYLDKIFQPFFTTKPAGQGTGLGLSLSYDIIKAHGGEFLVKSKEGEGAEFVISLPA
jgi:signal transduction histidine kinase